MFDHASLPTRIYSYGSKSPTQGLERVSDQMWRAHRYRNQLVEIERARRVKVDAALLELCPELAQVEADIVKATEKFEQAFDALNQARAKARKRISPKDLMGACKEAREEKKVLYKRRKELRTELFASEVWKKRAEPIEKEDGTTRKLARKECGLYWGTYLLVEQSMQSIRKGAPPNFGKWRGDGHIAVQVQHGILPEQAFGMKDTRIRIDPVPAKAWAPEGRKFRRTTLHFRVGSEGREPVWAKIPFVLHRRLPEDAKMKWVHLLRKKIGTHEEWSVKFVLSRATGWAHMDAAKEGAVGVDVGWRMKPDGSLRTAYWSASDGEEGEVLLSPEWMAGMQKVRDIQSIRDKRFDEARNGLVAWLKKNEAPDWLKERLESLHLWRSKQRLCAVIYHPEIPGGKEQTPSWRTSRFDGDQEIYKILNAWRKKERHLNDYEGGLRSRLEAQRREIYQLFAVDMRRRYKMVALEKMNLMTFHKNPTPDQAKNDPALKEHVRDASVSVMRTRLVESMTEVSWVPPNDTTRLCTACGAIEDWDHKELVHTCTQCDATYDQDQNAAVNLLKISGGEVKAPEPEPVPA